jgi:hypothetical protein
LDIEFEISNLSDELTISFKNKLELKTVNSSLVLPFLIAKVISVRNEEILSASQLNQIYFDYLFSNVDFKNILESFFKTNSQKDASIMNSAEISDTQKLHPYRNQYIDVFAASKSNDSRSDNLSTTKTTTTATTVSSLQAFHFYIQMSSNAVHKSTEEFYAPFFSLLQGSGSGKTTLLINCQLYYFLIYLNCNPLSAADTTAPQRNIGGSLFAQLCSPDSFLLFYLAIFESIEDRIPKWKAIVSETKQSIFEVFYLDVNEDNHSFWDNVSQKYLNKPASNRTIPLNDIISSCVNELSALLTEDDKKRLQEHGISCIKFLFGIDEARVLLMSNSSAANAVTPEHEIKRTTTSSSSVLHATLSAENNELRDIPKLAFDPNWPFWNWRRSIRHFNDISEVFFILADTTSRIANFLPPSYRDPSSRVSKGSKLILPFYHIPFLGPWPLDAITSRNRTFVEYGEAIKPYEFDSILLVSSTSSTCSSSMLQLPQIEDYNFYPVKHLIRNSRALFFSVVKNIDSPSVQSLYLRLKSLAKAKLIKGETEADNIAAVLACRYGLKVSDPNLASKLVANHCGTLISVYDTTHLFEIDYPPEPMLSEVASQFMFDDKLFLDCLRLLLLYIRHGNFGLKDNKGDKGELGTLIKLQRVYDKTAAKVFLQRICEAYHRDSLKDECLFSRPIRVGEFLDSLTNFAIDSDTLVTDKIISLHRLLNGLLQVTSWHRLENRFEQTVLEDAFQKSSGIICCNGQELFDLVIPVLIPSFSEEQHHNSMEVDTNGSVEKKEQVSNENNVLTAIVIQVKNWADNISFSSGYQLVSEMIDSAVRTLKTKATLNKAKSADIRVIGILMMLGQGRVTQRSLNDRFDNKPFYFWYGDSLGLILNTYQPDIFTPQESEMVGAIIHVNSRSEIIHSYINDLLSTGQPRVVSNDMRENNYHQYIMRTSQSLAIMGTNEEDAEDLLEEDVRPLQRKKLDPNNISSLTIKFSVKKSKKTVQVFGLKQKWLAFAESQT